MSCPILCLPLHGVIPVPREDAGVTDYLTGHRNVESNPGLFSRSRFERSGGGRDEDMFT